MKKLITLAAVFSMAFATFNAAAISAHYRAQLEKSGCTQLTDGQGCDIHKTKAQNQAAAKRAAKNSQSLDQISSEVDSVIGQPYSEANDYLLDKGWRPGPGPEEMQKGQWKMRMVVHTGKIENAQVFK